MKDILIILLALLAIPGAMAKRRGNDFFILLLFVRIATPVCAPVRNDEFSLF